MKLWPYGLKQLDFLLLSHLLEGFDDFPQLKTSMSWTKLGFSMLQFLWLLSWILTIYFSFLNNRVCWSHFELVFVFLEIEIFCWGVRWIINLRKFLLSFTLLLGSRVILSRFYDFLLLWFPIKYRCMPELDWLLLLLRFQTFLSFALFKLAYMII